MIQFHGVLDYYVIKLNGQSIIILLDNHALDNYCKYSSHNVDVLLDDFLSTNDTTIILEEIYGDVKFNTLFDTKHLNVYGKFYEKNKNNKNIFAIDIRILFQSKKNIECFFDIETDVMTKELLYVKYIVDDVKSKNKIFNQQYEKLKENYISLQHQSACKSVENDLNLHYPFINSICEEVFFSGLLELYTIAHILNSSKKNIIIYLGAAHCAIIFKLLITYYGFNIKRDVEILKVKEKDTIPYTLFNQFKNMCIDFKN